MPKYMKFHYISGQQDIHLLHALKGARMIGIDSEWRPTLTPFIKQRVAILQLSSESHSYVIDMIALSNNKSLD